MEAWDGWTITERRASRPPPLATCGRDSLGAPRSSPSSRCDSVASTHGGASTSATATSARSTPRGGESCGAAMSARSSSRGSSGWREQWLQEALAVHLSQPRRHRLVEATLQSARDFDPRKGLAVAAKALAAEEASRMPPRVREQKERCQALATPRALSMATPSDHAAGEGGGAPPRSRAEQRARCEALARPHKPPTANSRAATPAAAASGDACAYQQQRRCRELAMPRGPRFCLEAILQENACSLGDEGYRRQARQSYHRQLSAPPR
mmetsp:Transcript_79497/g.221212  ORF Transcript_79497/g.221212 Transcript_79497/m.221212 type:complete len:268 (+) Transcript_79497:91-894(+)